MHLSERTLNGVTVIDVADTLTVDNPGRLKEAVARVVRRGEKHLVLNLRQLIYVDSAGLGELVSCYTKATQAEATIVLAETGSRVQDLLEMTNLLALFEPFETEAAAAASFELVAA